MLLLDNKYRQHWNCSGVGGKFTSLVSCGSSLSGSRWEEAKESEDTLTDVARKCKIQTWAQYQSGNPGDLKQAKLSTKKDIKSILPTCKHTNVYIFRTIGDNPLITFFLNNSNIFCKPLCSIMLIYSILYAPFFLLTLRVLGHAKSSIVMERNNELQHKCERWLFLSSKTSRLELVLLLQLARSCRLLACITHVLSSLCKEAIDCKMVGAEIPKHVLVSVY